MKISSIDTLITDLPPSCIEFWPSHEEQSLFVIGTYNLEKQEQGTSTEDSTVEAQASNSQERNGSLILCQISDDRIQILHTLAVPFAILDLHFTNSVLGRGPPAHSNWFYTANSTGSIASFKIHDAGQGLSRPKWVIEQQEIYQLWPRDILVLSLCWHPHLVDTLSVTLSNGEVHVIVRREEPTKSVKWWQSTMKLAPHSLEAWTSAFLGMEPAIERGDEVVFSGGDDGILQFTTCHKGNEILVGEETPQVPLTPTKLPRKFHTAGVTFILPLTPHHILSGSYDDHIRLISLHPKPAILAELNLGGGVWRLKLLTTNGKYSYDILASCMHAGTRIVRVVLDTQGKSEIIVLATFEEHESMNYGSDFQTRKKEKDENKGDEYTVVSTSFYDKRVCLWRFQDVVGDDVGE